jgi:hypothetical protein
LTGAGRQRKYIGYTRRNKLGESMPKYFIGVESYLRFNPLPEKLIHFFILLTLFIFVTGEVYSGTNLTTKDKPKEEPLVIKKNDKENKKAEEVKPQPVPNAPEGWMFGLEKDGEWDAPFFDGWLGSEVKHKNDIRWSQGSEPVRKGEKSIRFNVGRGEGRCPQWACKNGSDLVYLDDHNSKRTDDLYDTLDQIQGEDFWYFFSVFIPKDFPDPFIVEKTAIKMNCSPITEKRTSGKIIRSGAQKNFLNIDFRENSLYSTIGLDLGVQLNWQSTGLQYRMNNFTHLTQSL